MTKPRGIFERVGFRVGQAWRSYGYIVGPVAGLVGVFFLAGIVLAAHFAGFDFPDVPAYMNDLLKLPDKTGWISHDHDTPVWIQGNWIIGEYRTCQMRTTEPLARKSLLRLSPESLAKLPRLFCGTGTEGLIDFEIAKSTDSNDELAVENDDWAEVSDKYFHVLPVTYWGRIDREEGVTSWRCQRNESSLTCKALN